MKKTIDFVNARKMKWQKSYKNNVITDNNATYQCQ